MTPDPFPHVHEVAKPAPKNHFPIVLQLGVLGLVLLGLFSGLFFAGKDAREAITTQQPIQIRPIEPIEDVVPQKIDQKVSIRGTAAYVWDVKGQRALYAQNADEELPLASITKLMTALLAQELISEGEVTTVDLSAIQQEGSSGLFAGEQFAMKDLQEIALVSSSNDAAFALGASVGSLLGNNDPTKQFVTGMNIRADELGLESLRFYNTTGLDLSETEAGAYGSARDISFLMEYIIEHYPGILEPTRNLEARVYNVNGEFHDVENTNEFVEKIPNLIGSKTGFTDLAGGNLTVAFDIGLDRPIIITVLGSTREERFSDVLKLVAAVQESVE